MNMKKKYISPQLYTAEYADDIMVVSGSTDFEIGGGTPEDDDDPNASKEREDFGGSWDYEW